MYYVENGTFLRFYPTNREEEALAQAAREVGREHAFRAYAHDARVPVIYHASSYMVVPERMSHVYGLIDEALDASWWGPELPGVTMLTETTELISVVFGSEESARDIAADMQATLTATPYF